MTLDFLTTDQVAARLGITPGLFRIRRETLIEVDAFPEPMPHCRRPMRWRADMVDQWIRDQGRPRALPPAARPIGPNIFLLEQARTA